LYNGAAKLSPPLEP
jgi:hypothetical protein